MDHKVWYNLRSRLGHLDVRRALSYFFLIVGVGLVVYVGTQYGSMYREQSRLERAWQAQQMSPPLDHPGIPADTLTRLTIPKIDLDSVVVEGTTPHDLLLGPGHLEHTATPGGPGNSVISAHRDTFFRHIYELKKGDSVLVQRGGKTYEYEVTGKKIIEPDDLSVIRPTQDPQLTLLTCYPIYYIGPAPKRLAVFAKLVKPTAAPVSVSGKQAAP